MNSYLKNSFALKSSIIIKNIIIVFTISAIFNLLINLNMLSIEPIAIDSVLRKPGLLLLSILITMPFIVLLMTVTNSYLITTGISLISSIALSISNSLKLGMRNEPVYPQDFTFLKTINELIEMLTPEERNMIVISLVVFLCVLAILIFATYRFDLRVFQSNRKSYYIRTGLLGISIFGIAYIAGYNTENNILKTYSTKVGFYNANWDQKLLYHRNGFVLGFTYNLPGEIMNKPEEYSKEKVIETLEKYEKSVVPDNETRSNNIFKDVSIVYILSESFSDPNRVEGVELTASPVQFAGNPEGKAYVGSTVVPIYGGGTPNSEFEVLTGLSIQNLLPNMALPYQDFMTSYQSFPSIVSEFKKNPANKAIALHAFTNEMYKRPRVFDVLGFDDVLYRDDLKSLSLVDTSIYVSDASIYNEALQILNDSQEDVFLHLITMQNHAPYLADYEADEYLVTSEVESPTKEQIQTFANGVAISDSETESFISAIDALDRNVIVVFYGDHLPGLYNDFRKEGDYIDIASTPYFIYSNFSDASLEVGDTQSLTAMNTYVKDLANVKMNGFDALVYQVRKEIPAGRSELYVDNQNNIKLIEELTEFQKELLRDYYLIQYDIIEGKDYTSSYYQ